MTIYHCRQDGKVVSRESGGLDAVNRAYGWRETREEAIASTWNLLKGEHTKAAKNMSVAAEMLRNFEVAARKSNVAPERL